jgi:polyferredoxin
LALLAGSALLVPLATGRQLYCHHVCPHGAAQQWLGRLTRRKVGLPPAVAAGLSRLPAVLLGLLFLLVLGGVPVNPAAWEPFDAWVFRASGVASIVLAVAGLAASVFHPLAYCRFGCPTGALLKFLRSGGSQDRFGPRDWAALALLAAGVAMVTTPSA